MRWSISYRDRVINGRTAAGWRRAPDNGLQVVRSRAPFATDDGGGGGWVGVGPDRRLWTGDSEYDPFGFGVKYGSSISDDEYWRIWCEAAYDGNPPESELLHPMKRA